MAENNLGGAAPRHAQPVLYPPLNFQRRGQAEAPEGFLDAEFVQPEIGAALYVVEDPDDRDFGWLGWQLPQYQESPTEVALEQVLLMVERDDREAVVKRTLQACAYADAHADDHPDPERVRALAGYYRDVLSRYRQEGEAALDEAPLEPPV